MQRTFIVGCPRSGTTIVQALLARHPAVYTLPETSFFEKLHDDLDWRWGDAQQPPRQKRVRQLGFSRKYARRTYVALAKQISGRAIPLLHAPLRESALVRRFVALLDQAAATAGRRMWLEKTPCHLFYIPEIEAQVPDARFVHVIRRGEDVLASVADASLRFDSSRAAFSGSTALWAHRWNHAVYVHGTHVGRSQHHFIFHEDLVSHQAREWLRLCSFLGLPADVPLDEVCQQNIGDLDREPWKHNAVGGQLRQPDRKVEGLFGPKLMRWLQVHLASYEDLRTRCDAAVPPSRQVLAQRVALSSVG